MTLPTFWRRASFSVAETAEMIGVTEETLRTWLARNVISDFNGAKTGGRIWLSALDAFYFLLVRDFTGYGVPVRTAMLVAAGYANNASDALPGEHLVVRKAGDGKHTFELTYAPNVDEAATLVIPMHRLATDLIDRAARVYVEAA